MKKIQKPRLIVVAGPNGSGKTTITEKLLRHAWMEDCVYINPDFIAKQKFGDWNSPKSVLKAANYAQEMRESCLADMSSMALETVFSTQEKLEFVQRAKEAGFFIRLFFVCTNDPSINAKRVALRVMEGGHNVCWRERRERLRSHKPRNSNFSKCGGQHSYAPNGVSPVWLCFR